MTCQCPVFGSTQCVQSRGVSLCFVLCHVRSTATCFNVTPCPVDCTSHFEAAGNCSGFCNGGNGMLPQRFIVTEAEQWGGTCQQANMSVTAVPCTNTQPCPPVDCVGGWVPVGSCTATCRDIQGLISARFVVSTPAAYNGTDCAHPINATRIAACTSGAACPWNAIPVSPPRPSVLPVINTTLNDTDIVIRGGNVTVSGVGLQGASILGASSNISSSIAAIDVDAALNTSNSNNTKSLRPRQAAFNGSLGFYTLGLKIEVLGELTLQRQMNWTYSEAWTAWVTQVAMLGKLLLTREELINDISVRDCLLHGPLPNAAAQV